MGTSTRPRQTLAWAAHSPVFHSPLLLAPLRAPERAEYQPPPPQGKTDGAPRAGQGGLWSCPGHTCPTEAHFSVIPACRCCSAREATVPGPARNTHAAQAWPWPPGAPSLLRGTDHCSRGHPDQKCAVRPLPSLDLGRWLC